MMYIGQSLVRMTASKGIGLVMPLFLLSGLVLILIGLIAVNMIR